MKVEKDEILAEIVHKFIKITGIAANCRFSILIEGKSVKNEKLSIEGLCIRSGSTIQLGCPMLLGGSSDNRVMNLEVNDSQRKLIGQVNDLSHDDKEAIAS